MPSYQFVKYFICLLPSVCNTQNFASLNGAHLRVIAMEYPSVISTVRNSSGHVLKFDGVLKNHITSLSQMLNFSFTVMPIVAPIFDRVPNVPRVGLDYLIDNEADFVIGAAMPTLASFPYADYPASWDEGNFRCIVPYPRERLNLAASLTPLSYQVWIAIIVGGVVVIIFLRFLTKNEFKTKNKTWTGNSLQVADFVLRNLVSQGQVCYSSRLAFRMAIGAWCCGCFFLVQIYCSTLTSHLTSPNQKPIASSVEELVNTPGLSFTTQKDYGTDFSIQRASVGLLKKMAEAVNKDPKFRCKLQADCLEIVLNGYAGYGTSLYSMKMFLTQDLKQTGICRYYMLKDTYLRLAVYLPLRKNSPYTEVMSIGILRIRQAGLVSYWYSLFIPTPWKCLEIINRQDKLPRLSIDNLSSAFVILGIGYVLGFIAFLYEQTRSCIMKHCK